VNFVHSAKLHTEEDEEEKKEVEKEITRGQSRVYHLSGVSSSILFSSLIMSKSDVRKRQRTTSDDSDSDSDADHPNTKSELFEHYNMFDCYVMSIKECMPMDSMRSIVVMPAIERGLKLYQNVNVKQNY
jgi:hypothetical protein